MQKTESFAQKTVHGANKFLNMAKSFAKPPTEKEIEDHHAFKQFPKEDLNSLSNTLGVNLNFFDHHETK